MELFTRVMLSFVGNVGPLLFKKVILYITFKSKREESKMAFCYRDKGNILHIVATEESAKEYASGEIKDVDVPNAGGYPTVVLNGNEEPIVDYGNGEIYVAGNAKNGIPFENLKEPLKSEVQAILDKIGL